ncbi:PIN domain-containing protein [Kribbella sp. NPDC055071]
MPFIVIYDANVLYPNSLRDLLIRVAQAGLVRARWTDQILDETFRHLKKNRHVLAAAIKANAQMIVTENTKDFPPEKLASWNLEAQGADDFILDLIDLDQQAVYAQVQRMADARRNPPGTVGDVLNSLEHIGLIGSVAALRG